MDPDGSITKYYNFVSAESREILEKTMNAAEDYYEFALRLGELVCNSDVSEELAFIGAIHIWRIQELSLLNKFRNKFSGSISIYPLTYQAIGASDKLKFGHDVKKMTDRALENEISDWVSIELLLHQAYFCSSVLSSADRLDSLNKARDLIKTSPDFEGYLGYSYLIEADICQLDGDMVNALLYSMKGLDEVQKHNNEYLIYLSYRSIGNVLRNTNPTASLEYLEKANLISKKINVPQKMHEVRKYMGLSFLALGEYDLALKAWLSALEVFDSGLGPDATVSYFLANLHLKMKRYEDALEWIKVAFEYHRDFGFSMMYSTKAEILIKLEKMDEVDDLLDKAQKMAITRGDEFGMCRVHRVHGVYQAELKQWSEAIAHVEDALSYSEPRGSILFKNDILLQLTELEIELSKNSLDESNDSVSGPWMSKLLEHVRKYRLPGIQMRAELLRAKYLEYHGNVEVARSILLDALNIHDSISVESIRDEILKKLSVM